MKTEDDLPGELPVRQATAKGCGMWAPIVLPLPDTRPADSQAAAARPGELPADSTPPHKGPER